MVKSTKLKDAFTLVELMVAMAIIAALLGMSVFGINLVQRSSRNTQRRTALNNLNLAVRNHQVNYGVYPTTAEVIFKTDGVYIGGEKVVEFKGPTVGKSDTTTDGTAYCYYGVEGSFRMGVKLEGSGWDFQLTSDNSDATPCDTANTITN